MGTDGLIELDQDCWVAFAKQRYYLLQGYEFVNAESVDSSQDLGRITC